MNCQLVPLLLIYDLERECYVIAAKDGGYLLLDRKTTDQQVEEGVFEQIGINEEAIMYGLTSRMSAVDLRIVLTKDVLARIISGWVSNMVELQVSSFEKAEFLVAEKELPLTVTVQWSVIGFKLIELDYLLPGQERIAGRT